jgi:hypothetical protein
MDELGLVAIVSFGFAFLVFALVWYLQHRDLREAQMRMLDMELKPYDELSVSDFRVLNGDEW